ncbi:MAG: glucose-6-phosphate isomerase [Clostridiales bacterium]|jgi:glucose-6-phosphate isomerase|nr:glucose-6-phosphate isomerase [Clostridiales bacterium]
MKEKITLDYNNVMSEFIGSHGISKEEIDGIKDKVADAVSAMKSKRDTKMAWRNLPYNQDETVDEIISYVNEVKDGIEAFVVLGIGGSALGPAAVQQAINHPFYNELPRQARGGYPKLYVADNVDPERLPYLFDIIDPTKCLFNVISKSGSTSETMSQFMYIKDYLEKKIGAQAKSRIVCTTDKEKGNLIKIAKEEGYKTFIVPSLVGGRFSELTPVGLLPAAFCGVDIKELLKGAAYMDELCSVDELEKNPAYMYAALNYLGFKKGLNISVMMPYADSLKYIADWYAQLWAESLGKKYDLDGKVVNVGQTPVKALGVTDQHSQVQLYTEGPYDKIVVLIGVEEFRKTVTIPKLYSDMPSLGFLGGITQNKLIETEMMATEYALLVSGKPNMMITLPAVNEFTLGQLLFFFEVATGFSGELLHINAFDQPGVEEGKNATYAMFGRPGYEEKKAELDRRPAKKDAYII